ncbi:NfeD family protein [Halanaerocella petrolearia]
MDVRSQMKIIILLILLNLLFLIPAVSAYSADLVYKVPIKGTINPGLVNLVDKGINQAQEVGADTIVFEIDTYGGLVDSAIKIRDKILTTKLSTVTYVSGRAWSAGALIALAGEELAMTPGSSIGAAETRPQEEKYISALRKEFKATAQKRGRNDDLAAAMVDKRIDIPDISPQGKLLTLTRQEAITHNIANFKVTDFKGLLKKLDLTKARVKEVNLTMAERVARLITNPGVSTFLLSIGFIALVFEVLAPGWGVGGTVGLLSLGLFFSSYIINGMASWGLVVLFIVGIVLMLLEVLVVPGFGITGIGGLIAIFSSLYLVFPTSDIALTVLAATLLLSIIGIWLIVKKFGNSVLWQRVSLGEEQSKETGYRSHNDETECLLGKQGTVINTLRPAGIVKIDGQRINVVSEGEFIEAEELVEVIEVAGNRVVVRKIIKEE